MSDLDRVIKVVDWLVFEGIVENRRDLAVKLNYTESSMSQILNGKVPLSGKFIKKLCSLSENINILWIEKDKGSMLLDALTISNDRISEPKDEYKINFDSIEELKGIIKKQRDIIGSQQSTINKLTEMLFEQNTK